MLDNIERHDGACPSRSPGNMRAQCTHDTALGLNVDGANALSIVACNLLWAA